MKLYLFEEGYGSTFTVPANSLAEACVMLKAYLVAHPDTHDGELNQAWVTRCALNPLAPNTEVSSPDGRTIPHVHVYEAGQIIAGENA